MAGLNQHKEKIMCKENEEENEGAEEEVPETIDVPDIVRVTESVDIPVITSEKEE